MTLDFNFTRVSQKWKIVSHPYIFERLDNWWGHETITVITISEDKVQELGVGACESHLEGVYWNIISKLIFFMIYFIPFYSLD